MRAIPVRHFLQLKAGFRRGIPGFRGSASKPALESEYIADPCEVGQAYLWYYNNSPTTKNDTGIIGEFENVLSIR